MRMASSKMQNLSHLMPAFPDLGGNHLFGPPAVWREDYQLWGTVMNFVRLVDFAVHEYEEGRKKGEEFWSGERVALSLSLASSHFETCLTSMHRAVAHLHAVKRYPGTPPHHLLALAMTKSALSGGGDGKIKRMRDAIQHLEARILAEGAYPPIRQGEALAIELTGNDWVHEGMMVKRIERLELGKYKISFDELARWLTQLHGYAHILARVWGGGPLPAEPA